MYYILYNISQQTRPNHAPSMIRLLVQGDDPLIALPHIMLPLEALAAPGERAYESYQPLQRAHTEFMPSIVDLAHVLEILFALTARVTLTRLTRAAIKLAFMAYYESEWIRAATRKLEISNVRTRTVTLFSTGLHP